MQVLVKASRWGAASLLLLAGGCVKVDSQPLTAEPFRCPGDGQVPVMGDGGWTCVAPDTLSPIVLNAARAGHAADAGTALVADHAVLADQANAFTTDATLHLGTDAGALVEVDAPFTIQGFPVAAALPTTSVPSFRVPASAAPATENAVQVASLSFVAPTGSKLHFRVVGTVSSTSVLPAFSRCDLELQDGDGQVVGELAVSATSTGTPVLLERTAQAASPLTLWLLNKNPSGNPDSCAGADGDLKILAEVIR